LEARSKPFPILAQHPFTACRLVSAPYAPCLCPLMRLVSPPSAQPYLLFLSINSVHTCHL
jgi:hypothetical protein